MTSAVLAVLLATGCTRGAPAPTEPSGSTPSAVPSTVSPEASSRPRLRAVRPADLDAGTAESTVQHLAGTIGPRLATAPAYDRASRWVARELRGAGLDVRRQPVAVPAGDSWGVPVEAGTSWNVVAVPPGLDGAEPHLVVGAHLDTVAVSPGAEDNASGVGVLLAAAEAVDGRRTRLPVVFVAFGAEEPRGPTDADHHYGSRAYVASLSPAERRAVRGMVSLDRVGVGEVVPVGSTRDSDPLQRALLAAAERAGVATVAEASSRSSDHWSFVRAGLPGVRLGSTPYPAYHSAADVPSVVERAQLRRTGRLLLAWLASR